MLNSENLCTVCVLKSMLFHDLKICEYSYSVLMSSSKGIFIVLWVYYQGLIQNCMY